MKALELTIHPAAACICEIHGENATGYDWNCDVLDHGWMQAVTRTKRLTDAELAAEFHCARADYEEAKKHISLTYWTPLGVEEDATAEMALKRSVTMLHFALRPHYDEVDQ